MPNELKVGYHRNHQNDLVVVLEDQEDKQEEGGLIQPQLIDK
jgi:hypothetical protein